MLTVPYTVLEVFHTVLKFVYSCLPVSEIGNKLIFIFFIVHIFKMGLFFMEFLVSHF